MPKTAEQISENKLLDVGGKPADCNEQGKVVFEYLLDNISVKSSQVKKLLNIKDGRARELLKQMMDK